MLKKQDNEDKLFKNVSFEAISYLLIDNARCAIFQVPLDDSLLDTPVRFLFQSFDSLGLFDVTTLSELIGHIDPKSEICEVKGVLAYHQEVINEILSDVRKTTTYIPLKVQGKTEPYELKLVRSPEEGMMVGVIMGLDASSYNVEKLYGDSYKDQMTGLFNKNALDYHFSKTLGPHYIGFLDIDRFKAFNDHYSHSSGDLVLKKVGQKLISIADPTVIFYRYGGDEFAFMTNKLDYEGAEALIKKIQNTLASIPFIDNESLIMSIGFSYIDDKTHEYTIFDALLLADYAMYKSKASSNDDKVHFVSPKEAKALLKKGSIRDALEQMSRKTKRKAD